MSFDPVRGVAARYRGVQVTTCSPVELLVLTFDGIARFLAEAEAAMEKKDRARVGERIGRCQQLLEQLLEALDREKAPELADNLEGVYRFCGMRLLDANLRRDVNALREVAEVLSPIREAFATISREAKPAAAR